MTDEFSSGLALRSEEEGLFARDVDGQLIRMAPAVAADFDKDVTVVIDGQTVTVKKAVPATDSQGNMLRDSAGLAIPRPTTIYDAAQQLYAGEVGEKSPIPVLCHQPHVDPVAVCRLCVVEISKMKRGRIARERKLLPACQHRVEETMEVHTVASPDTAARKRVETSVRVLTELLVGENLGGRPVSQVVAQEPYNELAALADRFEIGGSRFPAPRNRRCTDESSSTIAVDHDACILCDRCARGCNEVRQNLVIGHTGKGYATHISFDLNDPMGESGCVSCGECVISCPTGALTLRPGHSSLRRQDGLESVDPPPSVSDLHSIPLFANIPYKFLSWNAQSIQRRQVAPGEYLCREGEFGTTAFVLLSGKYQAFLRAPVAQTSVSSAGGWRRFLGRLKTTLIPAGSAGQEVRSDGGMPVPLGGTRMLAPPEDLIIGEMTCLNHYPRSATVQVLEAGEVLEIGRNVLYMLQRDKAARELLDAAYRQRALRSQLLDVPLLRHLPEGKRNECVDYLRQRAELVHVEPGQVIVRQGDPADHFYLVRLGFVKVVQTRLGDDIVLNYIGPGGYFGELGLLSQVDEQLVRRLPSGLAGGVRTATCIALDDVELVRIHGEDFRALLHAHPELAEALLAEAEQILARDAAARQQIEHPLEDFLEQGLFGAQKLLVLDLERCTRCDECTKACADSHEGVTRLIRDGLRFDKFLVASSCRSCMDPYCLVGCPVDAIHRRPPQPGAANSLEIVIEDWCIGCGQCSKNCPYGNINMHQVDSGGALPDQRAVVQYKATTCDLCREVVGPDRDVSCVYACPHNAAFRMSGSQLMQIVRGDSSAR